MRLKESASLGTQVLEVSERILGEQHSEMSGMESIQTILGSEHLWTPAAQSNVADILWNQGRTTDAISLKEQAAIAIQKALSDDDPDTSTRKGTIAPNSNAIDR